ncbi:MAG: hypothetical protein ABFS05_09405 [Bacteroidota bacterium]
MTNTSLKIYDLLKGTHVRQTMWFLDESQHWELEKLQEYQDEKLNTLLASIAWDVPFYRETVGKESVTWRRGDFEKLPIVDRKMLMEAGDHLLSENINLKKCKIGRTGGTTGPPLRLYRDIETRSWALAAYYRFYNWMGIEPGMPEVELWGSSDIRYSISEIRNSNLSNAQRLMPNAWFKGLRAASINRLNNFRSYNAFNFNDAYLEMAVNKIQKFRPALIRGYLSAIILLAEYIKRNNIKGIKPIAVSCTSETLFPEYRKMIEEVFQAPLFNQYGCGECNSIAFECSAHNGMHISMEHCMLEQDDDNNLIVTNLDNHSQPFIRYKNGDKGIISNEPCICGNAAPRLTELQGRANENIILKDGASVNGIFFSNLLDETGFINSNKMLRFQLVQKKAGEIEFKAEVKKELVPKDLNKLKDALMPFFSNVEITQHSFLDPGSSGKFRYLISELT